MNNIINADRSVSEEKSNGMMPKSQIEMLISIAHQYKRNLIDCTNEALSFIYSSREIAESCNYSRPIGKKGEMLRGESIRLAEIAVAAYGHIYSETYVIEETSTYVIAETVMWDVYKNIYRKESFKEPIQSFSGAALMARQSAMAKSYRNCAFHVLSRAWVKQLASAALEYAMGGSNPFDTSENQIKNKIKFEDKRKEVFSRLDKIGVPEIILFQLFNKDKIEDFSEENVKDLIGIGTSIKDGSIKVENILNAVEDKPDSSVYDRLKYITDSKESVKKESDDDKDFDF